MMEKKYFPHVIRTNEAERPGYWDKLAVFGFNIFAFSIELITKIWQKEDGVIRSVQKSVIPFESFNPLCPSMIIRLRSWRTRLIESHELFKLMIFERYSSIFFLMVYIFEVSLQKGLRIHEIDSQKRHRQGYSRRRKGFPADLPFPFGDNIIRVSIEWSKSISHHQLSA